MKNDNNFMDEVNRQLKIQKAAAEILGVSMKATAEELKTAYRKAAQKFHPDHNQENSDANKKFTMIKCAYDILVNGNVSNSQLDEIKFWDIGASKSNQKYDVNNDWGHFLWWKERFFGGNQFKNRFCKRRSCI